MNRKFDEIMELLGAEPFKDLIRKWERLSGNLRQNPPDRPVLLPDLLWVGDSGTGKTKFINMMADYLCAKGNLMRFNGDVKCCEFLLDYVPREKPFLELQRLEDELAAAAGFRCEFRGVILVDIDLWINRFEEQYFANFMEYLAAHSEQWLVVLSVSRHKEEKIKNLEAFLSMYLRLERITLEMPDSQKLCGYVSDRLSGYGLALASGARELLTQTLEEMRSSKYFDGYKSVNMLCQEIVYRHFSAENAAQTTLTEADLQSFAKGSDYVKKAIDNAAAVKMRKIGFDREED